jgi:hypothetical protein
MTCTLLSLSEGLLGIDAPLSAPLLSSLLCHSTNLLQSPVNRCLGDNSGSAAISLSESLQLSISVGSEFEVIITS